MPGSGDAPSERWKAKDWLLLGVECDDDDDGEGVVRVRDGVLARVMGLRKDTCRILSNGEA